MMNEIQPMLLVEMDDDFRIGVRVEGVAAALKFRAQLDIVEDLAVENDPD